jgi:phosphoenolpyruvate carboxykinase (ATP)
VRHPGIYAEMLEKKMQNHDVRAWLVNTGWTGGSHGQGARIELHKTRAIIDAINSGELEDVETVEEAAFGLRVPTQCPGWRPEELHPRNTWADVRAYDETAAKLARLFRENGASFER